MDRSEVISLVAVAYDIDDIGKRTQTETKKTVYANVRSVSSSEWFSGGQNGLKPQYQVNMFKYDYSGELIVEYNNQRYSVYRTYEHNNDIIELYLEKKAGI